MFTSPKDTAPFQIARIASPVRLIRQTPMMAPPRGSVADLRMIGRFAGRIGRVPVPLRPMLATSAETLPAGPDWTYEFKWDGIRALVEVTAGAVRVTTRLGSDATAAY